MDFRFSVVTAVYLVLVASFLTEAQQHNVQIHVPTHIKQHIHTIYKVLKVPVFLERMKAPQDHETPKKVDHSGTFSHHHFHSHLHHHGGLIKSEPVNHQHVHILKNPRVEIDQKHGGLVHVVQQGKIDNKHVAFVDHDHLGAFGHHHGGKIDHQHIGHVINYEGEPWYHRGRDHDHGWYFARERRLSNRRNEDFGNHVHGWEIKSNEKQKKSRGKDYGGLIYRRENFSNKTETPKPEDRGHVHGWLVTSGPRQGRKWLQGYRYREDPENGKEDYRTVSQDYQEDEVPENRNLFGDSGNIQGTKKEEPDRNDTENTSNEDEFEESFFDNGLNYGPHQNNSIILIKPENERSADLEKYKNAGIRMPAHFQYSVRSPGPFVPKKSVLEELDVKKLSESLDRAISQQSHFYANKSSDEAPDEGDVEYIDAAILQPRSHQYQVYENSVL